MKSLGRWFIYPVLLTMLIACGKENESGKTAAPVYQPLTSPYTTQYQGASIQVNQVLASNPCRSGFTGIPGQTQPYDSQRFQFEVAVNPQTFNPPTNVMQGDFYVGVTSFGDVAVIVGNGLGQPAKFIGYLCPRASASTGQGMVSPYIKIGASSPKCAFKPIIAATVTFPGGERADFRWMDGGSSMGQPFPMPICTP